MSRPQTYDLSYDAPYREVTARFLRIAPGGRSVLFEGPLEIPRAAIHGADEHRFLFQKEGAPVSFRILARTAAELGLDGVMP